MPRTPLYKQAETEMLKRIRSGKWPAGQRLGNEFELAAEFGVSQGTMRRALLSLEAMGHLKRKPGRGTVVADPAREAATQASFGRLEGEGFDIYRQSINTEAASPIDAALFDDVRLWLMTRTLERDGTRAGLEETALRHGLSAALPEVLPVDLPELLDTLGAAPARIEDRVEARMTTMSDSVALRCDRYSALLCLTRVAYDTGGQALARQRLRVLEPCAYLPG